MATETAKVKFGQIYEAKKPKPVGFMGYLNDRQIIHVSQFKTVMGHVDHGYNQEFLDWCNGKSLHFPSSEYDQIKYEAETGKLAKNIETLWDFAVQYDSPSVKQGAKYPTISQTKFLEWAGKDVTDLMPKGEWRTKTKNTNEVHAN